MSINKVIIIDDEPELVVIYSALLTKKGFEVDTFTTGEDGLNALKKQHYDLVLTDNKMPHVSGMDIIHYIEEYSPETIIFMITGDEFKPIAYKNNNSRVFAKPLSLVDLSAEIDKL